MSLNRFPKWLLACLLLATSLSGCLAGDAEPQETSGTTTSTSAPATNTTAPETQDPAEPPVAAFTVSVFNSTDGNMTAGAVLLFNASNSSDPEGGTLSFAWDFGDNATAEGVEVNHTFAQAGNYTVLLTVTSASSGLTGTTNQTLNITDAAPAAPAEAAITDPSGDALYSYLDLRSVAVTQDETNLIVKVGLGSIQPQSTTDTIFLVHFTLNKVEFEIYAYANGGLRLYDVTNGATVSGVIPTISGTTFVTKIPFEVLKAKKIEGPIDVFAQTWIGEGLVGGVESDDRAPNTGTFTYG